MKPLSLALAASAALVLAGASVQAAPDDGKPAPQCFRTSDIQNSVQTSRTRMNIKTVQNTYFQIDTKGICLSARATCPTASAPPAPPAA